MMPKNKFGAFAEKYILLPAIALFFAGVAIYAIVDNYEVILRVIKVVAGILLMVIAGVTVIPAIAMVAHIIVIALFGAVVLSIEYLVNKIRGYEPTPIHQLPTLKKKVKKDRGLKSPYDQINTLKAVLTEDQKKQAKALRKNRRGY